MRRNFYQILKASQGIAPPKTGDFYTDLFSGALAAGEWPERTITGTPPIRFISNGQPLTAWTISGNAVQDGTPAPNAPIMPQLCGKETAGSWTIPIQCGGQTVAVDLSQVQTVRKIRKIEFDGSEDWTRQSVNDYGIANFQLSMPDRLTGTTETMISTHFVRQTTSIGLTQSMGFYIGGGAAKLLYLRCDASIGTDLETFKTWLAAQYVAGTPTSFWYVLETSETAAVNAPLAKIGDYGDELSSTDAGITIPTARGFNTLEFDTDAQSSSVTITGKIKQA